MPSPIAGNTSAICHAKIVLADPRHEVWKLAKLNWQLTSPVATVSAVRTVQTLISIWRWINNFWDSQYNDPFAQSHEQLNSSVYLNVCFYISKIACNTTNVWPKLVCAWRPTTLLVGNLISKPKIKRFAKGLARGTASLFTNGHIWVSLMTKVHN